MQGRPKSFLPLFLPLLSTVCLLCLWLPAQNLRDPQFMRPAQKGFDSIRNLDYDEAEQIFQALRTEYPEHPAPPLYLATVTWLRELFERHELELDRFVAPAYFTKPTQEVIRPDDRRAFFDNVETCQNLAQDILDKEPNNKDARYFMGLSYGILASFSITIDRSKSRAFSHGKRAYKYHKELVKEYPNYYDAYMSVGLYEYIVDNLPWYIKWLAIIIGYRGDEEQGLKYLGLAAQKGQYASDDARVLQMVLFVREKRYQEALANARFLHKKYPRSYILHLNRAQILESMSKADEAIQEYQKVLELSEAQKPNYQKLPLTTFRYDLGIRLMKLKRYEAALKQFQESIGDPDTPERQRALSHLRAGQIFDVQGKRNHALAHYEQVLQFNDFDDSHDQAKDFLKRPWGAGVRP